MSKVETKIIDFRSYLTYTFREGNGTPLQYSCLENAMDRGAWWAAVQEVAELDVTKSLTLTHVWITESLCCTPETI